VTPAVALVFAVTATLSVLQFRFPELLSLMRREDTAMTQGEWWRLITPLFVQDGGWVGTLFNLATLLALGAVAAETLGWRRWLLLYFGAGIGGEIVAYTWIHQGFAGNSIANMGVVAGLAVLALRTPQWRATAAGAMAMACGLLLFAAGDLHGAAFAIGAVIAAITVACDGRRHQARKRRLLNW
jgi:membrane associated rhomboid family serine protease